MKDILESVVVDTEKISEFMKVLSVDNEGLINKIKENVLSRNDERRKPKIAKGTRDFEP